MFKIRKERMKDLVNFGFRHNKEYNTYYFSDFENLFYLKIDGKTGEITMEFDGIITIPNIIGELLLQDIAFLKEEVCQENQE